jgi:hypothetical protein
MTYQELVTANAMSIVEAIFTRLSFSSTMIRLDFFASSA